MNEREALEKISNISEINDCTCFYEDFKNCDTCDANKGCAYYIATQALAPQEPQEKTFTVEEIDHLTQKLEKVTNQRNILNNELIKHGCLYLQGVGFLKELNT